MTQTNVSQLFKNVRTQLKMSQQVLADKLNRDAQIISRVENGNRKENDDLIAPLFNVVTRTLGAAQAKKIFGNMAPVLKAGTRTAARKTATKATRSTTARKPARAKAATRKITATRRTRKAPVSKAV